MTAALAITLGVSIATFLLSVGSAMFISGARFGRMEKDISEVKRAVTEIREMFELRAKKPPGRR